MVGYRTPSMGTQQCARRNAGIVGLFLSRLICMYGAIGEKHASACLHQICPQVRKPVCFKTSLLKLKSTSKLYTLLFLRVENTAV